MRALVFVHAGTVAATAVTPELVSFAAGLCDEVEVLISGAEADLAADKAVAHGADLTNVTGPYIEPWETDCAGRCLAEVLDAGDFSICVGADRQFERDAIAYGATVVGLPVLPGCRGAVDGFLRFGRQGEVGLALDQALPAAVCLRPWSVTPATKAGRAERGTVQSPARQAGPSLISRAAVPSREVSLAEAATVVAGGRGLQSADGFSAVEKLADALPEAAVGASGAIVSSGWADRSRLVGRSGARVAPEVYIAAGISGAFMHEASIRGGRYLLAINRNPEAPLMRRADLAVVGDARDVLSALAEAVRAGEGIGNESGALNYRSVG